MQTFDYLYQTFAAFDDIILVHDGRIVFCGPQEDALTQLSSMSRSLPLPDGLEADAEAILSFLPGGKEETMLMSNEFYESQLGIECVAAANLERTTIDDRVPAKQGFCKRAVWEIYVLMRVRYEYGVLTLALVLF